MRIGIDARLYTQTGVGRYIRNIIAELSLLDNENEYIIYLRNQEYDLVKLPTENWQKKIINIPWHTVKEQLILPSLLLKDNLDVVHFPYFNVPIFYPQKYLLTIHDLIVDHFDTGRASTLPYPFYLLKRFGYKISLTRGIKKASLITAISHTTKQEIIDHYNVAKDKITVTYDALDIKFLETAKKHKAKNYYSFPYILYVGNAYPHKNLERLVMAFPKLKKIFPNIKLVLAGEDKFFYPRLKQFGKENNLEQEIIFFGNADDSQLFNLYSFSKCLVFPSLMEGFGLPNLEALACGILPVVSDIPVFREIWGDRLSYFDPYNIEDMAGKIQHVLQLSHGEYQKAVLHAQKRIEDFNWKKTALATLKIYEMICRSS
ncbi:glycosyltransferase family 4 protein [Candidatus Gottesmanbacteria bacterium]|nr:glycosyltransferase family 4 protein [Candidatus Gottesmanbacteria bacterium]MBI5452923.1 glycosyltransferase family 4 protein [Candidatus Gottesmanbacteria bacterium]